MFSNPSTPAFEEFLDMLGDTVELANHTGYRGGLVLPKDLIFLNI